MPLILEDGTGVHDANSYATSDMADTYHTDRGTAAWVGSVGDKSAALIRATQYIEGKYRSRWPGVRLKFPQIQSLADVQGLSWPRYGALDYEGFPILPNEIPKALINGLCEAALRELVAPGCLQPDLNLSSSSGSSGTTQTAGGLKREWSGDTGFEYYQASTSTTAAAAAAAVALPFITILDGMLAPILLTNNANFGFTERAY